MTSLTTPIIGNIFDYKAVKAFRLENMRFLIALLKTFQGPVTGLIVERKHMDKYGRPLLNASINPLPGRKLCNAV